MTQTTWHARLPFFYGWAVVGAVFFTGISLAGVVWATSVIAVPMAEDLGWSRSAVFAGMTVRSIAVAVGAPFLGPFLDRRNGASALLAISGVVSGGSLLLVPFVREPWAFLVVYGVVGGVLGAIQGPLLTFAIVPKWFVHRRGQATALASMGTGFAAFVLPPVMALANGTVGWRGSWVVLAGIALATTLLPALVIRRQPEDVGLQPARGPVSPPPTSPPSPDDDGVSLRQAVRTPVMWLLIAAITFGSLSVVGFAAGLVSFYVDRGFSAGVAALGLSLYGLASLSSRFLWGYLADRLHIRVVVMAICGYAGLSTLTFVALPGASILAYGALVGFGIGGYVALAHLVWAAYFGRRFLGAINGVARPFTQLSAALGPLVLAQSFDRTESYAAGLLLFAASWVACLVLMVWARPGSTAGGGRG